MSPASHKPESNVPLVNEASSPEVFQDFSASGHAQQAVLGSGIQNVYFSAHVQAPEPVVSVTPPFGRRDERLPIRGRDMLLSELAESDITSRVWVIHGLAGSGKTRLALEVAFVAEQRSAQVWWVSANDAVTLVAGMRAVGRHLGIAQVDLMRGDAADVIWQRLTVRRRPWLLVIDGADDPQMLSGAESCLADGRGWLRPITGPAGLVLVTSRDGRATSWGTWCHRRRLEMLPPAEAAAVLADHAGTYPRLGSTDDARMLATRLGGLPLALKIAGSYLASSLVIPRGFTDTSTIMTYRGYLEAMDAGQLVEAVTQLSGQMTQAEAQILISQTWELTMDRLEAEQLPEARRVLYLLAIFAAAPIPYELLLSPEMLAVSTVFPEITGTRLWQVLTTLNDFGLLELSGAEPESAGIGLALLHPLIRDASRHRVNADDRIVFLHLAPFLLEKAVIGQDPDDPLNWPILELLTPHIEEVFESLAAEPDCSDVAVMSGAHASYVAARYRSGQGFLTQAETLYRMPDAIVRHPRPRPSQHSEGPAFPSRGKSPRAGTTLRPRPSTGRCWRQKHASSAPTILPR